MNKKVHKAFEVYLSQRELKYTPQRQSIVNALFESKQHIEADPFIDHLRYSGHKISRGTVYSTLKLLVASGLVRKLKTHDNRVYYEPVYGEDHHDHLICTDCGKIFEFHNQQIEKLQESIAAKCGLMITNHSHTIYGHCQREHCPERGDL